MLENKIPTGAPVHTRDIRLSTHPINESRIIVQGVLLDQRHVDVFDLTGEVLKKGVIHHIIVRMLVRGEAMSIEEIEAEMPSVPLPDCKSNLPSIKLLEGAQIKDGFSKRVGDLMGGEKGCTHLTHLIRVMSQEIVHGWLTHKRQQPFLPPKHLDDLQEKDILQNSCSMWTENGPKMLRLKHAMEKND